MNDFREPRLAAYQILKRLEDEKSNSTVLLQQTLSKLSNPADRNLVTDLVLGTLRWRGKLLYWIQEFSRRPIARIDPQIRLILQLGLYQLCFTKIPQHAAIYETVSACKRIRLTSASSFVNGLLRAVQGRLSSLPEPSLLSDRWSHPEWLAQRWISRFGTDEAVQIMQTNNEPAPVYLRVNQLIADHESVSIHLLEQGVRAETSTWGPDVLLLREGVPQQTRSFVDGEFYIQDAGVEVLGRMIAPVPGSRILEIAAAPGGKTFQMAVRMKGKGLIVSTDTDSARMRTWMRNMQRLKIECAAPALADGRFLPFHSEFDQVVIDAPCSSLGVIRRHPEIKWWRNAEDLVPCANLQLQIVNSCAKYVRSQGALIYSVCSFEPEETTEVVAAFLKERTSFSLIQQQYLYPHRDRTDGFFIAKLKHI